MLVRSYYDFADMLRHSLVTIGRAFSLAVLRLGLRAKSFFEKALILDPTDSATLCNYGFLSASVLEDP